MLWRPAETMSVNARIVLADPNDRFATRTSFGIYSPLPRIWCWTAPVLALSLVLYKGQMAGAASLPLTRTVGACLEQRTAR